MFACLLLLVCQTIGFDSFAPTCGLHHNGSNSLASPHWLCLVFSSSLVPCHCLCCITINWLAFGHCVQLICSDALAPMHWFHFWLQLICLDQLTPRHWIKLACSALLPLTDWHCLIVLMTSCAPTHFPHFTCSNPWIPMCVLQMIGSNCSSHSTIALILSLAFLLWNNSHCCD